jgi:hypothetical protein
VLTILSTSRGPSVLEYTLRSAGASKRSGPGIAYRTTLVADGLERIALSISWEGGERVDLVKLVHNEQVVPYQVRIVDCGGRSTTIEYSAVRSGPARRIRVLFAFVGEVRRNLEARCAIDGEGLDDVVHEPLAAHRWEVDHVWIAGS